MDKYINNNISIKSNEIKFNDIEDFIKTLDEGLTNSEFEEYFEDLKTKNFTETFEKMLKDR